MVWLRGGQKEGNEFENLESSGTSDWLSGECARERGRTLAPPWALVLA